METTFSACSTLAMAGWLLLIAAPGWRLTQPIAGIGIPLTIGLVYLALIAGSLPGAEGGFGSLAEVRQLFTSPALLLAGWVHYLAFDLFIGAWEVRDARRHAVPHLLVVPCLVMTFMLGPIGLLAYFAVRGVKARSWTVAAS